MIAKLTVEGNISIGKRWQDKVLQEGPAGQSRRLVVFQG